MSKKPARRAPALKLSPAVAFIVHEIAGALRAGIGFWSAADIEEQEAKIAYYSERAKTNPEVWASDARRYKRDLAAARVKRALYLKGMRELKGML